MWSKYEQSRFSGNLLGLPGPFRILADGRRKVNESEPLQDADRGVEVFTFGTQFRQEFLHVHGVSLYYCQSARSPHHPRPTPSYSAAPRPRPHGAAPHRSPRVPPALRPLRPELTASVCADAHCATRLDAATSATTRRCIDPCHSCVPYAVFRSARSPDARMRGRRSRFHLLQVESVSPKLCRASGGHLQPCNEMVHMSDSKAPGIGPVPPINDEGQIPLFPGMLRPAIRS